MPKIMKLTDLGQNTTESLEEYFSQGQWVMQQKFDGTRCMVIYNRAEDSIMFSNDGVGPIKFSAAKLKLPAVEAELRLVLYDFAARFPSDEIVFDGELIIESGELFIWDVLVGDWQNKDLYDRLVGELPYLENLLYERLAEKVFLTPTAWTPAEKQKMWEKIVGAGVEGAVSKKLSSKYEPGARSKDWIKHKLVKAAEAVVTSATREFKPNGVVEKGSAQLAVYNDAGELQEICSASLIGKELTIEVGSVVEFEYLYMEDGKKPVQPRITRQRFDKPAGECTFEQFPRYSREAVYFE